MGYKEQLIQKLQDRTAVIGIIGLGYVGLPLAIRYAEAGYTVLGFDIDPDKPEKIAAGKTYFKHIPDERVQGGCRSGFQRHHRFFAGRRGRCPDHLRAHAAAASIANRT